MREAGKYSSSLHQYCTHVTRCTERIVYYDTQFLCDRDENAIRVWEEQDWKGASAEVEASTFSCAEEYQVSVCMSEVKNKKICVPIVRFEGASHLNSQSDDGQT